MPDGVWEALVDPRRLEVLKQLGGFGTPPDPDLERLARTAAAAFGAPIGLVTLVDVERQWFAAHHGVDQSEARTSTSFCAHVVAQETDVEMVVLDASTDPLFSENPLVAGPPHLRFYAGAKVKVRGQPIGTLCVFDLKSHAGVSEIALRQLRDLAGVAGALLEFKDEARTRARTAAALMREEWRHALTLEAGRVGSWIWDLRTNRVEANDILKSMFGIEAAGTFDVEHIFSAIDPAQRGEVERALKVALDGVGDYFSEFQVAGSERWVVGRGRVYQRDADGRPLVMMGVNMDVTQTRQHGEHNRRLLLELNHRVKNTLAMIQSLARQTLRRSPDPKDFIEAFGNRLRTLSDTHSMLSDRDWTSIGLRSMIESQVAPMLTDPSQSLVIEGDDVALGPDQAVGLGTVLNELATNAVKYGAWSVQNGRVTLTWTRNDPDRLDLTWVESGGPEVVAPKERGLGQLLIERSLDKIIGAESKLAFPPEGVKAKVSIPL